MLPFPSAESYRLTGLSAAAVDLQTPQEQDPRPVMEVDSRVNRARGT